MISCFLHIFQALLKLSPGLFVFSVPSPAVNLTKITFLLAGSLFFLQRSEAQEFAYIDAHPQSSEVLTMVEMDNHYYLGGFFEPESWLTSAPYLIKLGAAGDTVWTQVLENGGNERDQVVDMVAIDNQYLGVLGQINRLLTISKIDANGSINWSYASETIEHPVALTGTANGELMACGSCQSEDFNNGENTICIVKLDAAGKPQWTTFAGEGERIKPYALQAGPSGELILVAKRRTNLGYELFLTRISKKGKVLKINTLGFCDIDEAFALEIDDAGNLLIAGEAKSVAKPILVKLDPKGELIWQQVYEGDPGNYRAYAVSLADDKGYVLVGRTKEARAFLIKTDHLGNQEWVRHFSGIEKAGFKKILSTTDGYVAAGVTLSGNSNKAYCVKIALNP
ncbi:MAG: hypothetical protein RLO17_14880 [Cyclobacteriaceae bacterium]